MISLPYEYPKQEIPPTVYYPDLPGPSKMSANVEQIKKINKAIEEVVREPIQPIVEVQPVQTVVPQQDKIDDSVRLFYESKTRELILTQSKSSLDLFKIIHSTLDDFQTKIQCMTQSIVDLGNIVCTQQERINTLNDSIENMTKQLEKIQHEKTVESQTDKPSVKPPLKRSSSQVSSSLYKPVLKK